MELHGKFPQWGWLQGTPDHELRLADACISRPYYCRQQIIVQL